LQTRPLIEPLFDFAEITFCTICSNFSSSMRHHGNWKLLVHIAKHDNVRRLILYSEITKNTVENSDITVILSKKKWYNAVTPCDPGLHHCVYPGSSAGLVISKK